MRVAVKKKVLIFIDWYLPGYKAGGPIQSCANLVAHTHHDIDFYIITRNTDYCSTEPYETVDSDNWVKVNEATCYYISSKSLTYNTLYRLVREIQPDVVYINGVFSLYFSILPVIIAKRSGTAKILVAGRGMFAPSAVNVKSFKKQLFFTFTRFLKLYRGVHFHATNEAEKAAIQAVVHKFAKVEVAPNLPAKVSETPFNIKRVKTAGELRLVSVARIAPEKNTSFALEILSQYNGSGSIIFDMYGPMYDEVYGEACEQLIAKMPAHVKARYCGSLEKEKVAATLAGYHALLLPTRGENFGHIILESMTAGCGVIISDQTPWRGLVESGVGYDLPLQTMAAFHDAITEMSSLNQEEFDGLSARAFNFAQTYINNKEHIQANINLFI